MTDADARVGAFADALFEAAYGRILELRPAHRDTLNSLGNLARARDRLDEAAELIGRVVALDPGYAIGRYNLALVHLDVRRLGDAERFLREALVLDPSYAEAHLHLGLVLRERGRRKTCQGASNGAACRHRQHNPTPFTH